MKLLIEIGTEELPAKVINPALENLKRGVEKLLGIKVIKTYGTPRRLALLTENFENTHTEREELLIGPPVSVAYEEGKPTKALFGFLQKVCATQEEVVQVQKGEGTYVAVRRVQKEKTPLEKLKEEFETLLLSLPFPKRMRWNSGGLTFSRPIRWLCVLYGEEVVPLSFGKVKADRITYGHRFLHGCPLVLKSAEEYEERLKEAYVIPDFKERLSMVLEMLREEAYVLGCTPNYVGDLPEEVANLLEFPFPVVGSFERKYLELPQKVLITVLAHHQRFFCLADQEGNLVQHFVAFSGNIPNDLIRTGYERVVKARLEDAFFFYREDLKVPLEKLVDGLKGVVFHPKAGSVWEKTQRLMDLSERIALSLGFDQEVIRKVKRAAFLSKADLLTNMVKELDELQGYMGMVYAKAFGEEEDVAKAIYEHYLPKSSTDPLPERVVSQILSLADKLDNIAVLLGVGEVPSSSSDPYGLRRSAYGILAILHSGGYNLDLRRVLSSIPQGFEEFMRSRLEAYLEPFGYDVVRAVLEVKDPLKPLEAIRLAQELANLKETEKFKDIVEAYRRVVKILPKGWEDDYVEEAIMKEKEERELWDMVKKLEGEKLGLLDLWNLKEPIDQFFDKVLVMDKNQEFRRNRLALLYRTKKIFNRFGDLEKIVLEV